MRGSAVALGLLGGLAAGCGQVLGLGDFEDSGATGAGGGASTSTGATTATTATTTTTGGGGGSTSTGMACTPGAKQPCYTGPAGTENTGLCADGEQVCDEDGAAYGACTGEVTPGVETCLTAKDDDCDGSANEDCVCDPSTIQACYPGPVETQNVGICLDGQQKCQPDGLAWEACKGYTLPATETCAGLLDEDCDALECVIWAKQYGDASDQYIGAVGSDAQDNVILAGNFSGGMDLGDGNHFSVGSNDLFLAKLAPDGLPLSFQQIAGLQVRHARVDAADAVVIAAAFTAPVVVKGVTYTPIGSFGNMALKIDAGGQIVWAHQLAVANMTSMSMSAGGDVVLTGLLQGAADLGTGVLPFGGATDAYLVKLAAADGHTLWARSAGGAGADEGVATAVSGGGQVYLTGYYNQAFTLGGTALPAPVASTFRTFFAQLDASGNFVTTTSFPFFSYPMFLAAPPSGTVYMGITFSGSVTLGATTYTSAGGSDGVLIQTTASGFFQKATAFGGPGDDGVTELATDAAGNLLVGVYYQDAITFAGTTLTPLAATDHGVYKIDAQDTVVWARGWPGGAPFGGGQLSLGAGKTSLRVLVGQNLNGATKVGGISTVHAGGTDAFVASFLAQ